ncbi:MAG: CRTAC1 family protein [Saprospiraceae bacterium]|nr:CRTAC1 family protein [Saprospiraceae bacterium]
MSLTLQKLSYKQLGGKSFFRLAILAAFCLGLNSANALNPSSVSITNRSGSRFILNSNDPCDEGPRAAYVAYQICNTTGGTLTNLTATISGLPASYTLLAGQPAAQAIGTLLAGSCTTVFWYVGYPCTNNTTANIVVTVSDANPGTNSATFATATRSTNDSGSSGEITKFTVGPGLLLGSTTYVDFEYELATNIPKNGVVHFQPAGNTNFNAGCMRLTRTEIRATAIPTIVPLGSINTLQYVAANAVNGGGKKKVTVRYHFLVNCNAVNTEMAPYAASHSGNTNDSNFKYHNDYAENDQVLGTAAFPPVDPCLLGSTDDFASQQVGAASGLEGSGDAWSAAWGDFDNDGFPDLFVTTHNPKQPNELYVNNKNGTFTKVEKAPFNSDVASSSSASWGDFDNDGDLDLYVANNIGFDNFLYRNEGGGSFTKILNDPIVSYNGYSHGVSWGDYDNDGYLDMFVAVYWETAFNLLYHNNGDGTFSEVTNNPVTNEASRSVSGVWGDYDNDGLLDLFVANTGGQNNSLYHNLGGGNFERITTGEIVNDGGSSVGASWADYDNDGDLDLFVANAGNEPCFLYKNNGGGSFGRMNVGAMTTDKGHAHGSAWADYDNDGDLDLFVARDGQNNSLYRNDGGDVFTSINNEMTSNDGLSFGTAWADYDRDGDLDLFVANRKDKGNFFFKNNKGTCKNWSSIKLVGTRSNKAGIGAKVSVTAKINGVEVTQMREVSAQSGGGTGGQNDMRLIFGMGNAASISSITVVWPTGYRQTLSGQPVNQHLTIQEDNTSEVSGRVYFEDGISCSTGQVALPAAALTANFRSVKAGSWNSSATWAGGIIPNAGFINNQRISIEHDVTLPSGLYMQGTSAIWVTNAKLTVNGTISCANGAIRVLNGELLLNSGSLDLTGTSAYLHVKQSRVTVANGSHYSVGKKHWENATLQVSGSYDNNGIDTLENVKMLIGGNIQNTLFGAMVVDGAVVKSNTGGFQNIAPAQIKGNDLVLWIPNGVIQNLSFWTASVAQYCTPTWSVPTGISASYLPAGRDCGTIADRFVADPSAAPAPDQRNWIGIPYARVSFPPSNVVVFADEDGFYSAFLPVGNYTAQVQSLPNFIPQCPNNTGSQPVAVTSVGQHYQNNHFGHSVIANMPDLFTEVISAAHRIGEDNLLIINFKNLGTATAKNTVIQLSIPAELEILVSSIPFAAAKNGNAKLEFPIGDVAPNGKGTIYISYTVGLMTPIGTDIVIEASISNGEPELSTNNNASVDKSQAVAAYDPNDIAVSPARFVKKDEWLHYKIRFQNVGNIPASQVRVEDELPAGLDLSTLELGGVSHTYKLQSDGRKLTWIFPNINLPDSLSNEAESHGYITFRIKPEKDLEIGHSMKNRAAIYFDNLAPVITNTVENILVDELAKPSRAIAKPLQIHPNPSAGKVTVQSFDLSAEPDAFFVSMEVFDPFGRQVHQSSGVDTQRQELYLYELPAGTYHVKAVDSKGRSYAGKVVLVE